MSNSQVFLLRETWFVFLDIYKYVFSINILYIRYPAKLN